jgi:glycine/D-amino acid oxidase-like deaminating enzyme
VKDFDLAIVGRGIAGLALAREILIRTKLTVAIIGPDTPVS